MASPNWPHQTGLTKLASPNIDHDRNFKNLISTFFIEFLELFLPELAQKIDPKSITFLKPFIQSLFFPTINPPRLRKLVTRLKLPIAPVDRPKVKAQCLRLLVTLKLDPARSRLIAQFVDDYLRLDAGEEQTFQVELDKLELTEKEAIMQATTSWEERGMEKATQAIALNMLKENIPSELIIRTTGLTIAQLPQLQTETQSQ